MVFDQPITGGGPFLLLFDDMFLQGLVPFEQTYTQLRVDFDEMVPQFRQRK